MLSSLIQPWRLGCSASHLGSRRSWGGGVGVAILGVVLSQQAKAGSLSPSSDTETGQGWDTVQAPPSRLAALTPGAGQGHMCAGKGNCPGYCEVLSGIPGHPFSLPPPPGARSPLLPDNHRCVPRKVSYEPQARHCFADTKQRTLKMPKKPSSGGSCIFIQMARAWIWARRPV